MTTFLSVGCPKCGAAVDKRCRTTSGTNRTTDTHSERIWVAQGVAYTRRLARRTLTKEAPDA